MSKNIKRILIAGGAVVVLALAFVILKFVFPEEETPVELVSPTPTATEAPVYYIIKAAGNDVVRFDCTYEDGSTFQINISQKENGMYEYAAVPDDTFFGYNTSKFRSMMYTFTSLTGTALVEKDPEDLSIYGLDEPQFTITITFKDDTNVTLYVGSMTPVQRNYYVMTKEEQTVYTVGNYLGELLMRKPSEFRNVASFPKYEEEEIYTNINHVLMHRRDGTPIEIWLDKEFSMPDNKSSSVYMMTQPVVSSCADEKIESLLDILATISYADMVGDITPDQFKEYGFDAPARLRLEDTSGNSIDLAIGTTFSGAAYACLWRQYEAYQAEEVDFLTVLRYSETDFEWVNVNYMNLLIRAIWIINIHDVESITYDFDGEIFVMELYEYDDVTGSGVDVVRTCSHINGKDIHETNTKRIFSRTLNFREVNTLTEGMTYDADYSYSITVKLKSGEERVMTFHRINDRQYACVVDGVAEYYVYAGNMQTLMTAIERAMDDREVSLVYTN